MNPPPQPSPATTPAAVAIANVLATPTLGVLVRYEQNGIIDYAVISSKNKCVKVVRDSVPELRFMEYVLASCNTWVLVSCTGNPHNPRDFVWNSTTREVRPLHPFNLASPRSTEIWAYGVGCAAGGGEYKVVRSRVKNHYLGDEKVYAEVLSLTSGSWKEVPYPYDPTIEPAQNPSLYINGFYYWAARECIISFDFANEKFPDAVIPMPGSPMLDHDKGIFGCVTLGELGGRLAAITYYCCGKLCAENKPFTFEVWVWNDPSWSQVSTYVVPEIHAARRVVGLYLNDNVLLEDIGGNLLVYICETTACEKIGIHDKSLSMLVFPILQNESDCASTHPSSVDRHTSNLIPAPARQLPPSHSLKFDLNRYRLMLLVQYVIDGRRDYAVFSTENNSFKLVGDDDEEKLPKLSLLRAQNYDIMSRNAPYDIVASCNLLTLLLCQRALVKPWFCLWEPMTNRFLNLPDFELKPHLPFPIFSSYRGLGLGFDPASQSYKVVRCRVFEYHDSKCEVRAELISLGAWSWKEIPYPHDPNLQPFSCPSPHISGFYYWLAMDSSGYRAIISFDFANEEFPALIPLPKIDEDGSLFNIVLVEVKGLLGAVVSEKSGGMSAEKKKRYFEIWVWNNGGWTRQDKFEVPDTAAPHRVLGIYKNHYVLLQDSTGYLLLYDCAAKRCEKFHIRDDTSAMLVFPYFTRRPTFL